MILSNGRSADARSMLGLVSWKDIISKEYFTATVFCVYKSLIEVLLEVCRSAVRGVRWRTTGGGRKKNIITIYS